MSPKREERIEEILKFVQEHEPCTFGEIKKYLIKGKKYFDVDENNNKPLARELESLTPDRITRDPKTKPYPTYRIVQNYSLDTAIMGESFRENYVDIFLSSRIGIDENYLEKDMPFEPWDSNDKKFIKSMVTRYGFYMLSILIKSYEQSITRKHFDRKIWIQNAIDLMKDEPMISRSFISSLGIPFDMPPSKYPPYEMDENIPDIEDQPELDYNFERDGEPEELDVDPESGEFEIEDFEPDLTKRKNKKLLKNKLSDLRKVLKTMYPKLHDSVILYDLHVERHPEKIKSSDIKKIDLGKS